MSNVICGHLFHVHLIKERPKPNSITFQKLQRFGHKLDMYHRLYDPFKPTSNYADLIGWCSFVKHGKSGADVNVIYIHLE